MFLFSAAGSGCTAVRSPYDRPDVPRADGTSPIDGATDASGDAPCDAPGVALPRQRTPLSGAIVAAVRPRLRWETPRAGTPPLTLEMARTRGFDPADTRRVALDPMADAYAPTDDLAAGTWYWRLRARVGGACEPAGPTWQLRVRPDGTTNAGTRGWVMDLNGDGLAEIVGGAPESHSRGEVLVYYGARSADEPPLGARLAGVEMGGSFGFAVAPAGDVDGDGFVDLVVGAPGAARDDGAVYVFRGGPDGVSPTPQWTLAAPNPTVVRRYGRAVATAGDMNSDGFADVVVGAGDWGDAVGAAYVYFGSATGPRSDGHADVTLPDPAGGASVFAGALVGPGDIDGDGFDDVLVSANWEPSTSPPVVARTGAAYLYFGSDVPSAVATSRTRIGPPGGATGVGFGVGIGGLGDLDSDGRADFAVAADYDTDSGTVYLYRGGDVVRGTMPTPAVTIHGPNHDNTGHYGFALVGGGDVTGDDRVDLVISQERLNETWVYAARSDGSIPVAPAAPTLRLGGGYDGFGFSVAVPGDFDGDGIDDLIVGAPGAEAENGLIAIFRGARMGLAGTPDVILRGTERGKLGYALARSM